MRKVDVAIIGAGSAGLAARREVAKTTDSWVVIDDGILGTTCARVGCMPSKVLIQSADDFARRKKFAEQGILGAENLSIDTDITIRHVRSLRDRFVRGVSSGMASWMTDDNLIRKRAKFIDKNTLDLGDEKIWAKTIIIATGSTPFIPPILKDHKEFLLTTDFLFEQEHLPKNIAVIGLGVIGIELGQALSKLDLNILGVARREMIAGVSDPEILEYVVRKFDEQLDLSFEGVQKVEVVGDQLKISTGKREFLADKVLVTTGRSPNLASLNLDCLGVKLNKKGIPNHSKTTFQIEGAENIYLPGDVNGDKPILHEASDEGRIAGFNATRDEVTHFQTRTPLEVTFCDPNIASAGMKYQEIKDAGIDFQFGKVLFEGQGRSIVKLKEIGMLKVFGETKTGKILGAEMFGPDAEHIAHLMAWVISMKMTVNQVLALPFYHPVIEEGLRTALRDLREKVEEQAPQLEIFPLSKN
jgi:dihydrolipoamide dehydrogenase